MGEAGWQTYLPTIEAKAGSWRGMARNTWSPITAIWTTLGECEAKRAAGDAAVEIDEEAVV